MEKFIVAEITKNWNKRTPVKDLISQKFEMVINVNNNRGYKLIDWKLSVANTSKLLTETIVAIFERVEIQPAKRKK